MIGPYWKGAKRLACLVRAGLAMARKESQAAQAAFFQTRVPSEFPALDEKYSAAQEKHSDIWFRYGANKAVIHLRKAVAAALAKSAQNTKDATGRSQ